MVVDTQIPMVMRRQMCGMVFRWGEDQKVIPWRSSLKERKMAIMKCKRKSFCILTSLLLSPFVELFDMLW